jgi:hypothetical protein
MAPGTPHTGWGSAALVRLLTQWGLAVPAGPGGAVAASGVERLSEWLSWTDAIAVARALGSDAGPAPASAGAASVGQAPPHPRTQAFRTGPEAGSQWTPQWTPAWAQLLDLVAEAHALHARLLGEADALVRAPAAHRRTPTPAERRRFLATAAPAVDDPLDLNTHQARYRRFQREMGDAIGPLRARLRQALAAASPELARLAAVDATLDEAITPRERQALTMVPAALARRFATRRDAALPEAVASRAPAPARASSVEPDWLTSFRQDQRRAARAELDLRWAPLDGLLQSLPPMPRPEGVVNAPPHAHA